MPRVLSIALCLVVSAVAMGQELPNRPGLTLEEDTAWIVTTARVSRQLKLDQTQQKKVSSAFGTYDRAEQAIFAHGPATEAQLNSLDHQLASNVLGALTAKQKNRLHQIALQLKGPFILDDPAEAAGFGLKAAQQAKIHSIVSASIQRDEDLDNSAGQMLMGHPNATPAQKAKILASVEPQRQALAKRKRADAQKILNLLTSAQRKNWDSSLGEKMP